MAALPSYVKGEGHLPAPSLIDLISRGLVTSEVREARDRLYASDVYCQREATLNALNFGETTMGATGSVYVALGNVIEDLITTALLDQKSLLFSQYRLPETALNLGGRIDAIVVVGGKIRLIEIKSVGDLPPTPKLHHRSQALTYSVTTGLPASILYFSRKVAGYDGELLLREFPLDETPVTEREAVVWRAAYAHFALAKKVVPDIPYHITRESDCEFCNYRDICWRGAPLPARPVTPQEHTDFVKKATSLTKNFLDPDVVADRRRGILNHLQRFGTKVAVEALSGSWESFI